MSTIQANKWKLECRKKLEDNLHRFETALRDNFLDPEQRIIEIQLARNVSAAIERFERGNWDMCRECKNPIGQERLIAKPTAEYCIACQTKMEKQNRFGFSIPILAGGMV